MTTYRFLQTTSATILAYGLWAHDVRVIAASIGLAAMWWLIAEEVVEGSR